MAGSLNVAQLIGNLGKDPDIRKTQDGRMIANFSIATSETWKDKATGEKKEATEWHTIAVFNENLAKVVEQYLKKGSKVFVQGKIQTRKWQDKEGKDRWSTEIVLQGFDSKLILLGAREGDPGRNDYSSHDRDARGTTKQPAQSAPPASKGSGPDDEIPF
jgi:single-strand DNA-binding protein